MARRKRSIEIAFSLPWWVPAVLADAVFFSPEIAVQIYPPKKSAEGLPVYSDLVMNIDMMSPYLAAILMLLAVMALLRKTMLVRKKAHHSVKKMELAKTGSMRQKQKEKK